MLDYNVVFEHKTDGSTGTRFIIGYENEEEFKKMNSSPDEYHSIIAKGVTENEAQNLCSLTPEVCYLTAAIQEACTKDGHIDVKLSSFPLQKAFYAIVDDREYRQRRGLRLNASFPFVEIGKENTEKNRLYRYIKKTFTSPDGAIGIVGVAYALINLELAEIALDRLTALLK